MIRFAVVVAVHPQRRTIDLVYTDTGLRVPEVNVPSGMVSSDSGIWDIPSVQKPKSEAQAGALPQDSRQLVAAVAEAFGQPIVLGFFHPLAGMMAFNQDDRYVHRHQSGVYSTTAPDGSIEVYHPSGAYARIGTGAHEPLAPLSANQNWTEVNTAPKPTITLTIPGNKNGPPLFSLVVGPDGTVTMSTEKAVNMTAKTGFNISTPQAVNITAEQGVNIHANVAVTGVIGATGDITAGQGGASVELLGHSHSNSGGTGVSGPPVPGS